MKLFVTCLVAVAAIGISVSSTNASPHATTSAKRCSTGGNYPPASYVTSIKVKRLSCSKGRKVVKAYHKCRKRRGGNNGRCGGVKGYSCGESRRQSVPGVQYSTTMKCRKGGHKVTSSYTQNV